MIKFKVGDTVRFTPYGTTSFGVYNKQNGDMRIIQIDYDGTLRVSVIGTYLSFWCTDDAIYRKSSGREIVDILNEKI